MTDLTVDASVWVAAADQRDAFHEESRSFLAAVAVEGLEIVVPEFAVVEVACALARKVTSTARGRQLARDILSSALVDRHPVDETLLSAAHQVGTSAFLRGADALYAATAQLTGAQLVSWDNELVRRVEAVTPTT
jgi:predicted nucleic acid-binding protein